MADKNDWIADKLMKQEDALMAAMAARRLKQAQGIDDEPATDTPPAPVVVDPAAERQAFAELAKFLADTAEDDTEFTVLTPDEFAAETFTPPTPDTEE